ncbi:MAG: XdhC family protein [Sandaracinus sp.]|nr:XdhC family protein [Sandaracinus sp.]
MRQVTEALLKLLRDGGRGALATVVRTSGSAPQVPGARLLLRDDGSFVGTVGGGAIEESVLAELRTCLVDGKPRTIRRDLGGDLGMCCGGRMEVFVELVESTPRLVIFGAGHVARPTASFARTCGFEVWVVDDREELNTEERFPGCTRVLDEPLAAVERIAPRSDDWLFVVTHDHALDEEALDRYARLPHRYLGLIGSRRKVFRILHRLSVRGPLPPLDRVYAPVGLDLGAVSPEEIAISVLAELVALRHGRPATHLRAIDDPRVQRVLAGELTAEAAAALDE